MDRRTSPMRSPRGAVGGDRSLSHSLPLPASKGVGLNSPRGGMPSRAGPLGRPMSAEGNKGQTVQQTIQQLADEQERVQRKTFTNWMNSYLCKKIPPIKVENLFDDIKDGLYLLYLLEVLSGAKLPMESGPRLQRIHYVSNISNALRFLESKQIKLVNINPSDIADGKPSIVLGLVWTIILYFQIEESARLLDEKSPAKMMSPLAKFRVSAKKALLQYTSNAITSQYGINITDFHKSWRDGVAFNAMIHSIRPELVNMDDVRNQSSRVNLEHAFSAAETHLGIPRLIDPEDVDVEKPDEKSIMTYVAQFMKTYPDAGEDPANRKRSLNPADQEMKDYGDVLLWLQQAEGLLIVVDEPITDLQQEFQDYSGFKTDYNQRETIYLTLSEKVQTNSLLKVTPSQWTQLNEHWVMVSRRTREWLRKLDTALPGKLGQVAGWVHDAEDMLKQGIPDGDNHEEMAALLQQMISKHKEYFKDTDTYKQLITQVKRNGRYEGKSVEQAHIGDLSSRFMSVVSHASRTLKQVEYEEYRHHMSAFILLIEIKLSAWSAPFKDSDDTENRLTDYQDFVQRKKYLGGYDKLHPDLKKRADAYKKESSQNKSDVESVNLFMDTTNERWKKSSKAIQQLHPSLQEMTELWRRYNNSTDLLVVWLDDAEATLNKTLPEKQKFFQDLKPWEEKQSLMNESANGLSERCEVTIATTVKETTASTNQRYHQLLEKLKRIHQEEVVDKAKKEYDEGIRRIDMWLASTDDLLTTDVPCEHATLKDYLRHLDNSNVEVTQIEVEFKATTKTAQSLVKDSNQDEVNMMLQTLNVQKEGIVRLRKDIAERMKYLKALLPNVESLETGIADLNRWLDDGEGMLTSHKLDGDAQSAEGRLEKHKAFFAETTYQKSILESKGKVFQKVLSAKPKLKNIDFIPLEQSMDKIQSRFQTTVVCSREWEGKLDSLTRSWRMLYQKAHRLEEWLEQAELTLGDNEDDTESLIRKHKHLFSSPDVQILIDVQQAGDDVTQQLHPNDREQVETMRTSLEIRWATVNKQGPIRLVKLSFFSIEDKFVQQMDWSEKTLSEQKQQINQNENLKEVLKKHRQLFHDTDFISTCTSYLDTMASFVEQLSALDSDDVELEDCHDSDMKRFRALQSYIDVIHTQLKQLPERWNEYNIRMLELKKWLLEVNQLTEDLQSDRLTGDQYQSALDRFQIVMSNLSKFSDDTAWLQQHLDDLVSDAPDSDAAQERDRLANLLAQFRDIQPNLSLAGDKSGLFSRCYKYRDDISRRSSWLDDTQKQLMDNLYIDGVDEAKTLLHEHEHLLEKLDEEATLVESDIQTGMHLQNEEEAPEFVHLSVQELQQKWKDTTTLAQVKHDKLKQSAIDWEQYEGEKVTLLQYLKTAETELDKAPAAAGQELAEKELQSKKELQHSLNRLKGSLTDMQKLNSILADGASRERRGPLRGEMTDIDKRLQHVSVRLNAKLSDLEVIISRWEEYYRRLNNFCDWLGGKEEGLNEVYETEDTSPDEQLDKAKVICSELYSNHITLENLEKDARGLSQNFRSRETSALKSKLTSVRRQWESLCSRSKDRSSSLSTSVTHWNLYHSLSGQLEPWILKAEKYCSAEVPKSSMLDEAQEVYNKHQEFIHECEEQFPIFEKMNAEAGYLMDQPNIPQEVDAIQKRWTAILTSSEQRSHQLDKSLTAWRAHKTERQNFEEVLEKLQKRLAVEPQANSTDVQVLEHELALCKTIQEEVRSHQPQYKSLERQYEQLMPHASPDGLHLLQAKQNELKQAWENIGSAVTERQTTLSGTLQHRREFYNRLQGFEKWMTKVHRKLDNGNEIYTDEIGDNVTKLKSISVACNDKDQDFNHLSQEFKDLIHSCPEDETAMLSDRFNRLISRYSRVEDLVKHRGELCHKWTEYEQVQKGMQMKLKQLRSRLDIPELKDDEVRTVQQELAQISRDIQSWNNQSDRLDELMITAQMTIKDRATQRTLHFSSECHALESICDHVTVSASQSQEHLAHVTTMTMTFEDQKESLVDKVKMAEEHLVSLNLEMSSIEGLKHFIAQIEDVKAEMAALTFDYEQLRETGRSISHADSSKMVGVQTGLSAVGQVWDSIQTAVHERQQSAQSVLKLWQQYTENRGTVNALLDKLDPVLEHEVTYHTQSDVQAALDKHKTVEFELHASQASLDTMNNKGLQLLSDLKTLPGLDVTVMEEDLDDINYRWETANATAEYRRKNLDEQNACWENLNSGSEELTSWVNTMVTKLEDCLGNFDDVVGAEARLQKFKEELPYYAEIAADMRVKAIELEELNKAHDIPSLSEQHETAQRQLERASELSDQLERVLSTFTTEQQDLQREIEAETAWLHEFKDSVAKCDSIAGTDEELASRLTLCKNLEEQLGPHKQRIELLVDKANILHTKYPSAESASLTQDVRVLAQKLDSTTSRVGKTEDVLSGTLEQRWQDVHHEQKRWMGSVKEKIVWCDDIAGDRYSLEAKLATVKELLATVEVGEQKSELTLARGEIVQSVLPGEKQTEIQMMTALSTQQWNDLVKEMDQAKVKLETSLEQWKTYDQQYENVTRWLKDAENRMKTEAALRPNIEAKKGQLEMFKSLEEEVMLRSADIEAVGELASGIQDSTGDSRPFTYSQQIAVRYQALLNMAKEQAVKQEQSIESHEEYEQRRDKLHTWLATTGKALATCMQGNTDEDTLQENLATLQALQQAKEDGFLLFNATLDSGEMLYPSTSNEGRESVRHELRGLRDSWEQFTEQLNETQRQLDSSRMQWASFDESCDQIRQWIVNTEAAVPHNVELKNTLQEKKAQLLTYKSRFQEIQSHHAMISSLGDKGGALSSSQATDKLDSISAQYKTLASNAQSCLNTASEQAEQHLAYADAYQQCSEWLGSIKEKLSFCADMSGDKLALQNRIDKVKELIASMKSSEDRIKEVALEGERAILQTAPEGQEVINRELEALIQTWDSLTSTVGETETGLQHAMTAYESYTGSCDILSKWLRQMDGQMKDVETKGTLREKQAQIQSLKELSATVNEKRVEFEALVASSEQLHGADSRLIGQSAQVHTRYEQLQLTIKDLITRWESYVQNHEAYSVTYESSADWLETLGKRLEICNEPATGREDVEDRLQKLQALLSEKEAGGVRIQQVVESGEGLYASTASDGRDTIRQQLRSLRDKWESFCDDLSASQSTLDQQRTQWSDYEQSHEQAQKWLLDTEMRLRENDELKATVPEKKAQLQAHKVLHQDVLAHQHAMDALLCKSQTLSQHSDSNKVVQFAAAIQRKYDQICIISKQTLTKCELTLKDHSTYQDTYKECSDWLTSAKDKASACWDISGDKMAVQNKLDRIKDYQACLPEGEQKMKLTTDLAVKTLQTTAPAGQEVIQKDLAHLDTDWQTYTVNLEEAQTNLESATELWQAFSAKQDRLTRWVKEMEHEVKSFELKGTLQEKQAQLEKFKDQRNNLMSRQDDVDSLCTEAQTLMQTSSDLRLNSQVSQLSGTYTELQTLNKDMIAKMEKQVEDQKVYEANQREYTSWLEDAKEKLLQCSLTASDPSAIEQQKLILQSLLRAKDAGLVKLNATLESGEQLHPATSVLGREKIRQDVRSAKDDWDVLFMSVSEAQHKADALQAQWSSYSDSQDQLLHWIGATEKSIEGEVILRNSLPEKRAQLQSFQTQQHDILSHQRLVDMVLERAQAVLQATPADSNLSSVITDISARYENLVSQAKGRIQHAQDQVESHQRYSDSLKAIQEWLSSFRDRLSSCSATTGDKHVLQNKLHRVQELIASLPDGEAKLKSCDSNAGITRQGTAPPGCEVIQHDIDALSSDWEEVTMTVNQAKENLDKTLLQWASFEERYDSLVKWIRENEQQVKDFPLKSTIEEKQEQLYKFQDLHHQTMDNIAMVTQLSDLDLTLQEDIRLSQNDVDRFSDEAQSLLQQTSEGRISVTVSQLTSRYQSLLVTVKELVRRCDQNVEDHSHYQEKLLDFSNWLHNAQERYTRIKQFSGSKDDLEQQLEKIQEVLNEREAAFIKLNQMLEAGERLYPNTAPDGRDQVRKKLREMKIEWESLFDDLSAVQRKSEVSLVQWSSFDESYGQVEQWISDMEMTFEGSPPLRSTLEEKRSQLQRFKALQQDVLSYQRVIDTTSDRAQGLVGSDTQVTEFISQARTRYLKLCSSAKEYVHRYDIITVDHSEYNDAYNDSVDWVNNVREKLQLCSDMSGDRHAIQGRLDRIQDILTTQAEGEPRIKNVQLLAEKVMPNTAPQGRELIVKETQALQKDWEAFVAALTKTKAELEGCMDQWKLYDEQCDSCNKWLRQLEGRVKDIELKGTLLEKIEQLQVIKNLLMESEGHQKDRQSLTELSHRLAQTSTDSRVIAQTSQLNTRYETLNNNCKDLIWRWEQYITDHQTYHQSHDACIGWLADMRDKQTGVQLITGDRDAVEYRLKQAQSLLVQKEEGFQHLQQALDNSQLVLPNTSVSGRDAIRQEMQALQQEYDSLVSDLNKARVELDSCLTQWTVYRDGSGQVERWLDDLAGQLDAETKPLATLEEKRLHLERVKVLEMNVSAQNSSVMSLRDKATALKHSTEESALDDQTKHIVNTYEQLINKTKDLQLKCEQDLTNHQKYRDAYIEASDWLTQSSDHLLRCTDVRGDQVSIESNLERLKELTASLDTGHQKLESVQDKSEVVKPTTSDRGQGLINEEVSLLSQDYQAFEGEVIDSQLRLEEVLSQWTTYEEIHDSLTAWVKGRQQEVTDQSQAVSTFEEKTAQLEKLKTMYENVVEHQPDLDSFAERVHVLLQSTTNTHIAAQLSHLNSLYSALITKTKECIKSSDRNLQDHSQYQESCMEVKTWIKTHEDRLSVCADTSGDKFAIQTQLEKVQEFNVLKDEGQLLLHTANTWGDNAIKTSSPHGCELITNELQELQQAWDKLTIRTTDTKVALESCLLRWTDYNESLRLAQKWIKDMERRVREREPSAELGDKKAQLQALKSLVQDVIAYEHMIDSISSKAQEIHLQSPSSKATATVVQINERYAALRRAAQDLLSTSEVQVNEHQNYTGALANFQGWLRAARDALATCSEPAGDKTAITAKLDKLKALEGTIDEGNQKLADAIAAGEVTLPHTSASGQTKIRQEFQALSKELDDFSVDLREAETRLETAQMKWIEFDQSFDEFDSWLKATEKTLKNDTDPKATLDEKKDHLSLCKSRLDDIMSRQSSLDLIQEKGATLQSVGTDLRLSQSLAQISTRYQALVSLCRDMSKRLDSQYYDHTTYDTCAKEFADWLADIRVKLDSINDISGTKDEVGIRLDKSKDLQSELDRGYSKLRNVNEGADKTLLNTNQPGSKVIKEELDTMRTEYESLKTELSQTKRKLEDSLHNWSDFERTCKQLNDWIGETETKLKANADLKADLPEKRAYLERYRVLHQDIESHKDHLERLTAKAGQLQDPGSQAMLAQVAEHYEGLLGTGVDCVDAMESQVVSHEGYRNAYNTCSDWLAEAKKRLQDLNDTSGDCEGVQARLQAVKDFQSDLSDGEDAISSTLQHGEELCESTSTRGQGLIQRDMQALQDDWRSFNRLTEDVQANLESCVTSWKHYDVNHREFATWLEKMDGQSKATLEPKSDTAEKNKQLEAGQVLYEEMLEHKGSLDQLRSEADSLSRQSTDPQVSSNVSTLATQYQTMLNSAKNMIQSLTSNANDHKAYSGAYDDCLQWLEKTNEKLSECNDASGDWNALMERIALVKEITLCMDEGLQQVNHCCDMAEKILPHTDTTGKKTVEKQITRLTSEWEQLNANINDTSAMLENMQGRWQEFEDRYRSLMKWMTGVEATLMLNPESKAQLIEKKTQLDKYRLVLSDIDNHQSLMSDLSESATSLEDLCSNPDVIESLVEVQNRYEKIKISVQDVIGVLDQRYEDHLDFHEGYQETEQWLLQTSFKLMSHNTLNVSSLELTRRQITKHKALLDEIENYRGQLDNILDKGQTLVQGNPDVPDLAVKVQTQIQNLDESYRNLQATAAQIKTRLDDVEKKWHDYKTLLESQRHFLCEDVPQWLDDANANLPDDLQDAYRQLETSKSMWEKLNTIKQELLNAAHRCESLGSSDTTDRGDESSVAILSEEVNHQMQEGLAQIESRMNTLRDIIQQWESVDRQRTELRTWLRQRQEEVQELEQHPSKLHPEAAEIEIDKLQGIKDEISSKGGSVETFVERYKTLTQHNPTLADPVIKAVKEDWEELLGQVNNLIHDKEYLLQQARNFQRHLSEADDELDDLAQELDNIDHLDACMDDKASQSGTRRLKKSRGAQTPDPSARYGSRSNLLGSDDDDDDDSDGGRFGARSWRGDRRNGPRRYNSSNSLRSLRSASPRRPPSESKKLGSAAALESDTDESGYGDTCTLHASSFDIHDDALSFVSMTPRGIAIYTDGFSERGSTNSLRSEYNEPIDPMNMVDASSQTLSHSRTQTPANFDLQGTHDMDTQTAQDSHTQTDPNLLSQNAALQTSLASLHTLGTQTRKKKKKGARSNMLKNILSEVKNIKSARGLGASANTTLTAGDDETESVDSDTLTEGSNVDDIKPQTLQTLLKDVKDIRMGNSQANQGTQTAGEQSTQTGPNFPPQRDLTRQLQHSHVPVTYDHTAASSGYPMTRYPPRVLPAPPDYHGMYALHSPHSAHGDGTSIFSNMYDEFDSYSPSEVGAGAAGPQVDRYQTSIDGAATRFAAAATPPLSQYQRRVNPQDLQVVNDRLQRLRNYQIPSRRNIPRNANTNTQQTRKAQTHNVRSDSTPNPAPSTVTPGTQQPGLPGYVATQMGTPMWSPIAPGVIFQPFYPAPASETSTASSVTASSVSSEKHPRKSSGTKGKYRIKEFTRSYDDLDLLTSDTDSNRRRRRSTRSPAVQRVISRYDLEDSLHEATQASEHLRILSEKMKTSLRHEILKD